MPAFATALRGGCASSSGIGARRRSVGGAAAAQPRPHALARAPARSHGWAVARAAEREGAALDAPEAGAVAAAPGSTTGEAGQQRQQEAVQAEQQQVQQQASASAAATAARHPPYALMAGLAAAGAAETAYLAAAKLAGASVACPIAGGSCDAVLSSAYATLLGLPLPLYGAAAYGAVAALAALGAREAGAGRELGAGPRLGLAAGVGALSAASGVLMYVLATALGGAPCVWCYTSAGLSLALAALLVGGSSARQLADAAGPGLGATAAAAALLAYGFGDVGGSNAAGGADFELPYSRPEVTTESSPRAVELAKRLRDAGARMYGAFWCSHCFEQEQAFGRQAMAYFPYAECFPDGWRRGVQLEAACEAVPVRAFPTWVIGDQIIEGEMGFDALDAALDSLQAKAPAPAAAETAVVAGQ